MANFRWRGGAATQTQVDTITFTGVADGAGVGVTVTLTSEDGTTTEASVTDLTATWTATQARDAVLAAIGALTSTMFFRVTWASSGTDKITGTAKTAGVPFYLTVTTSDGVQTAARAATTVNRGPNDVNTDGANGNWVDETGAATTKPAANGDVDILPHPTDVDANGEAKCYSILYGLYQASINLLKINIPKSFRRATVGDPVSGYYLAYDVNQATSLVILASEANAIMLKGTRRETIVERLRGDALRLDGTDTLFEMSGPECAGTVRFRNASVLVTGRFNNCPQARVFIGTSGTAITTFECNDAGVMKIDRAITSGSFGANTDITHTAGTITNPNMRGATLRFNGTGNMGSTGGAAYVHHSGILTFADNFSGATVNIYNSIIYSGMIDDTSGLVNVALWTNNGVTAGIIRKGGLVSSGAGTTSYA